MRDVRLACKSSSRVFGVIARRVNLAARQQKQCHTREFVSHAQMGMYRLWAYL